MEIRIALTEWLRRIPEFELDRTRPMTWSEGAVRGPRLLPIVIGSS
jgi:cytochrome P450